MQHGWPVLTYTAEQLATIQEMPNPSAIVAQAIDTSGVCEPAAMLASGSRTLLVSKQKHGRVTMAIAQCTDSSATLLDSSSVTGREIGNSPIRVSEGQMAIARGQRHVGYRSARLRGPSEEASEPDTFLTSHPIKCCL